MINKLILIAGLFVCACSGSSSHIINGPNGSIMVRTTCHPDVSECLEEAGNTCPNGYQVVNTSMHMGGTVADWLPGPVTWYNVLVQCD